MVLGEGRTTGKVASPPEPPRRVNQLDVCTVGDWKTIQRERPS